MTLQKDAADLNSRADAELQTVINELTRVHGLVASFQDQIREVRLALLLHYVARMECYVWYL